MHRMLRRMGAVGGLVLLGMAATTWAQESLRVRGTIERVEGAILLVKARDGAELKVVLADNVEIPDIYRIASEQNVQIRRLNFRRDTLEDIFLKAMESTNGGL